MKRPPKHTAGEDCGRETRDYMRITHEILLDSWETVKADHKDDLIQIYELTCLIQHTFKCFHAGYITFGF